MFRYNFEYIKLDVIVVSYNLSMENITKLLT